MSRQENARPMTTESTLPATPTPKEAAPEGRPAPPRRVADRPPAGAGLADGFLILLFLGLTFLLGVFPLKDTDFYWHLRTGDLIRQTGEIPRTDPYTFTRERQPWIDLHWVFQVAISWVHERGGIVGLNLTKCVVTCVAVLLLITARRRDWPVWVMLLAWLPALLMLGGRMYVRPETLTLLYLAIFLAVVSRWDRHPALAMVLPPVQVAWGNTQGLFVLGPIIVGCGLIGALLRPGALSPQRRRAWRWLGAGSAATLAACLVNPYGITGALYPIQLAGTMSNPVFRSIGELTPIPDFIKQAGLWNLPLQLHLTTMALGALSFLIPLAWAVGVDRNGGRPAAGPTAASTATQAGGVAPAAKTKGEGRSKGASKPPARAGRRRAARDLEEATGRWRVSPFRLLLFIAFSYVSLQATRNSHQFAAVVGAITAWNLGEWAAAVRRRRAELAGAESRPDAASTRTPSALKPRLAAGIAIAAVLVWVGSGVFYQMAGEKRTIGLGEEPLWFPHEAARFAGRPELPARFLSFHNGHASLFEYYHGPERKVYTDPRLEVAGADLFERYEQLSGRIAKDEPSWRAELDAMGRPVVLVDHEYHGHLGAMLLKSEHWRCVWFDAIAACYVHDSATEAVRRHAVDFAARHFRPDRTARPGTLPEWLASARALRNTIWALPPYRADLVRPLVWLGLDDARRALRDAPGSGDAWRLLGQIELAREPASRPSPRFRLAYDPVLDLSSVRATYALRRALEYSPGDFFTLWRLAEAYGMRLMFEAELPVWDRIAGLRPLNLGQREFQAKAEPKRAELSKSLGRPPATTWKNHNQRDQVVAALLAEGRAETAAAVLEGAYPPDRMPWEVADRAATLRLHLGEPARARALWQQASAAAVPRPAIAIARIGATYLAEGDFEAARRAYRQALEADPGLFEASYSLAVLEQDAGDATAAHDMALRAVAAAPGDVARAAARAIAAGVARFAATPGGASP
jgi:tetratricopeptide (TPR) repeat protein